MNESIKRVIIGIVIIVVLIFVGIVIFKKKDPKLFKSNDNLKSRMWNNPKECTTDCLNTNPGFTEYNCRKTCGDYNVFCFNECVGDKYPGKDKTEMCYKQCM
jgi:uncharacterized protein YxeA